MQIANGLFVFFAIAEDIGRIANSWPGDIKAFTK